jgi:hypothetical protein
MNTTEWFPADVKPVHVGIYQVESYLFFGEVWHAHWDGKLWSTAYMLPEYVNEHEKGSNQDRIWRGLKEPA